VEQGFGVCMLLEGGSFDRSMEGPGYQCSPQQYREGEEPKDSAYSDEDCAVRVGGLLHVGRIGGGWDGGSDYYEAVGECGKTAGKGAVCGCC